MNKENLLKGATQLPPISEMCFEKYQRNSELLLPR